MIAVVLLVVLVILVGYLSANVIKPKDFPPGPKWYPFIGSNGIVQDMTKKYGSQWKGMSQIAKQYSTKVLGLKLGSELVVVVYGEKNIRHVLSSSEFDGRPDNFFLRLRCLGKRMGITFSDGPLWREHRQFTVKHLRHVGFGKTTMEREIQNETKDILETIKSNCGHPQCPKKLLAPAVMNIMWKYTAGERIEENRLALLLELLNARSKAFSMAGGLLNQFPLCRFIIPELSGYKLITEINEQLVEIIEESIQKHKRREIVGSDFIYSFLEEMKLGKESYTDEQLKVICLDLLIAGSQTSSNVLEFALLTLIRNQSIQQKIYEEIETVIGSETPGWDHSHRMIYTSAFILEVQRYYTIVPLAGPRRVLSDATIEGYSIPTGTSVLICLGDLHFDPEMWESPQEFMPERFIGEDGTLKSFSYLMPFGLGRRRCPGDSLAKSFIFIALVGILQKYKIVPFNGVLPNKEPIIGILSAPHSFEAEFIPRD